MKKYIEGQFELDENIVNLESYVKTMNLYLLEIDAFCKKYHISYVSGTTENKHFIFEYRIVAESNELCNAILKELKSKLKRYFPYVKLIWHGGGDYIGLE